MHMTLVDPAKQPPGSVAEVARKALSAGTDAIMVGGSTGVTQDNLDETIDAIRSACDLPVIYFPSTADAIATRCDAIYFMSMLNSRNVKNVTGEQSRGAPVIRKLGLEPISMGYVIVEPGMKVGEVGEADAVARGDNARAVGYALTADFFGMDLLYLEAGSGAPEPVPSEMIRAVRSATDMPILVGGGVTDPEGARAACEAGADIIVTGTLVENGDFEAPLKAIVDVVHGTW